MEPQGKSQIKLEKELELGGDFSAPSYEEWKKTAEASLKGAPFEKKLVTRTLEGIDLQPIYTREDIKDLPHLEEKPGAGGFVRGTNAGGYLARSWEVCQEIPAPTPKAFNDALTYDLKRGQTAVNLKLDSAAKKGLDSDAAAAAEVGNNGVAISTLEDLETALTDIDIEKTPIHIEAGFSALEPLMLFNAYVNGLSKDISKVTGSIDADPLGYKVSHGNLPISLTSAYKSMARSVSWAAKNASGLKTVGISGLPYHNAGADAVGELAFVLATAVEYIEQLKNRNVSVDDAALSMRFTFGIGSFYFMEVAKIRAARLLWSKIIEAYDGSKDAQKMTIHGRTSGFNKTVYDPYVNMLRTTTESFSAIVGGVDSLHSGAFNERFGAAGDEFSRRTSRNTQIMLNDECRLGQVIDPAGGSYYVETLTHQVAEKAWKLFQEIEAKGGMLKALQENFPQEAIAAVNLKRQTDLAKRKSLIVGTNFSANIKEKKLETVNIDHEALHRQRTQYLEKYKRDKMAQLSEKAEELFTAMQAASETGDIIAAGSSVIAAGATLGQTVSSLRREDTDTVSIKPLTPHFAAETFEALRDAVETYKDRTGSETGPQLFLATMGPLAQYKGRADFSQSFFEVGGFDVNYPKGFDTPEAAVQAAVESRAKVVVICSTDDTYPELVPPITKGLKETNPDIVVVLAGYPKEQVDAHKASGVDEFIFLGADAHGVLSGILAKLGIVE
jgi:methylmalonyl-CoA mutase